MTRNTPPKDDEFELSVIGPGRGECIILHLGGNKWCVVDSCVDIGKTESAAVEYLSAFGQAALDGVELLVATHWHDDHIRAIASALRAFSNARFSCSIALRTEQFVTLVERAAVALQGETGLDEFKAIYEILIERNGQVRGRNLTAPMFAIENRELLNIQSSGVTARVHALSPSDGTFKQALDYIARLIPEEGKPQKRITNITPNNTSVVLWVSAGSQAALLGADLEHSKRSEEGWLAVLGAHKDGTKAGHFKIPHHGSPNADCQDIWDQMLQRDPVAIVTRFNSGRGLPQKSDLDRIAARTPNLYCTAPIGRKPPKREPLIEKLLRGVERYVIDGQLGHVRIRSSILDVSEPPRVELFNGAFKV